MLLSNSLTIFERKYSLMIEITNKILSTTMCARLLGCTESTVRKLIKTNQLPAYKLEGSNRCLVKRDDILQYQESKQKNLVGICQQG